MKLPILLLAAALAFSSCSTNRYVSKYPQTSSAIYSKIGEASYYEDKFEGTKTANGEIFHQDGLTAAHRTLAFGTRVKVTNLSNEESVIVTINDRGPLAYERIIDLTKLAAQKLDFIHQGKTQVALEVISGSNTGGSNTGGSNTGGSNTGGSNTGGSNTGESNTGESNTGESSTEGTMTGGSTSEESNFSNGYGVQLASLSDANKAEFFKNQVKSKTNLTVFICPKNVNSKLSYKVIVGDFKTRAEAVLAQKILESHYTSSFITTCK